MKNLYLIGILVISFVGCKDFLGVQPKSFSNSKTFYDTQTGLEEGVNGAYSSLQDFYGTGTAFWAMAEMRSDNTTFEYNESNRGALQREQIDYFEVTEDNLYIEGVWSSAYEGIAQCNTVLDHMENVEMSDTTRSELAGQATFIRALYYFNLVRMFGGVPLILHEVKSRQEASAEQGRASVDEVYAQIIKDAEEAAANLPEAWPGDQAGRATKAAANTLLGEVYLTREQYQEAVNAFQKVIEPGNYSLMASYADLYKLSNENNSESIFEIQYASSIEGEASSYIYTFAPLYSGDETIGSFSPNSGGGRNIPTRNIQRAYEQGDLRGEASIAWHVDPENTQYAEAQHDSIPYIKKYAAPPSQPNEQDVNFYVYRYAQVLLWTAEAMNEMGQTGQAHTYLNRIRERAGLDPLTGLNQSDFREAIYQEERVESAFENHRWFQLIRTGRAAEVMTANGEEQKNYQTWLRPATYNLTRDKLLYPIPVREVNLNNLQQNPGW